MLNYGEALANLSDDKIICRLFDWNCKWLSQPNIAISEMASTLTLSLRRPTLVGPKYNHK